VSWMAKLYETYERAQELELAEDETLMPICHTLQNAHINIVVDGTGQFLSAKVLNKTQIFLPSTEKSAGRSSGQAAHPLADKIQYVAADYDAYGGKKSAYFDSYALQLNDWCVSDDTHPHVQAVNKYISKGNVVRDLVQAGVCHVDESSNILLSQWEATDDDQATPEIFRTLPKTKGLTEQGDALVCWSVHQTGEEQFDTWKNEEIQNAWISYDSKNSGDRSMCFITGDEVRLSTNHPKKIRHTRDQAKLVSANDTSGYTYRGRFADSRNCANISFLVTQKAHNALRWLIGRRNHAFRNDEQVILSWAVSGKPTPPLDLDFASVLSEPLTLNTNADNTNDLLDEDPEIDVSIVLGQQFAVKLKKYMSGYAQSFSDTPMESVIVMSIDSAVPGRMAVTYYRDFFAKNYIDLLSAWHEHFAWPQRVSRGITNAKGKSVKTTFWVPAAPTPWAILNACYGDIVKSNEALKKQVTTRVLPCIVEKAPLPEDLLNLAIRRASNPNSGEHWEWERNIGVACALYKGFHHADRQPIESRRRYFTMALDEESISRDYLFGRLLAIAERIEEQALFMSKVRRPTTSQRLMQRFADRPSSTWLTIFKQLDPYMRQLRNSRAGFLVNREKEIDSIVDAFQPGDFTSDRALSGEFLLGFHCQRLELRRSSKKDNDQNDEE